MARKTNHTISDDIASIEREIGELMHDLETRVGRLNALTRHSAKHAAGEATDYVADAVSDAAERVRNTASDAAERFRHTAGNMSDEAARLSNDALRRVEDEVSQRPLLTLAIAAGIGFLAGMAGRRH